MAGAFKKIFLEVSDDYCDFPLYFLKYNFLDYKVEDMQRFGALLFLGCSLYEHLNVHFKQCKKELYREDTKK